MLSLYIIIARITIVLPIVSLINYCYYHNIIVTIIILTIEGNKYFFLYIKSCLNN